MGCGGWDLTQKRGRSVTSGHHCWWAQECIDCPPGRLESDCWQGRGGLQIQTLSVTYTPRFLWHPRPHPYSRQRNSLGWAEGWQSAELSCSCQSKAFPSKSEKGWNQRVGPKAPALALPPLRVLEKELIQAGSLGCPWEPSERLIPLPLCSGSGLRVPSQPEWAQGLLILCLNVRNSLFSFWMPAAAPAWESASRSPCTVAREQSGKPATLPLPGPLPQKVFLTEDLLVRALKWIGQCWKGLDRQSQAPAHAARPEKGGN